MSAQPAEQPLELDTARIYRLPEKVEVTNPILDAPLNVPLQPVPDAVLPPAARAKKRKAKTSTGARRGRPANKPKPAEPPVQPAPTPQTVVASAPGGRSPFLTAPVSRSTTYAILACMASLFIGAALGFWAIR